MSKSSSQASRAAAAPLLFINSLLMICCGIVIASGLWVLAAPHTLSRAIHHYGSDTLKALLPPEVLTVSLGVALTASASFFLFVSFMGFHGALTRSQFSLFMYSTLVLLLLLLECSLFYYFSSSFEQKGLQEHDGQWTHALRLAFGCCEHNYTSPQELKPPWSCCGPGFFPDNCNLTDVSRESCQAAVGGWLDRYGVVVYATLATAHVTLLCCSLLRRRS